MNFKNSLSIILSLKFLLKGPLYDTKAEASKTSPTIILSDSSKSIIDLAHLSFSLPKADTSLYARFNLLAHLSASLTAAVLASLASLNSAFNFAN